MSTKDDLVHLQAYPPFEEHDSSTEKAAVYNTNGLEEAVTNERELNQGFSLPSLLAVALMLGGAWANLFNTLSITIVFGGSVMLLYGIWVTGFGMFMIYLTLAEYSSSWPTSAGPQEWAFQLFPNRFKRAGSYFVAWSLTCLYLFVTMTSTVIVAKQIAGLAAYRDPTWVPQPVHVWAINVGILFISALVNAFGIRAMHSIQSFSLVWFILGFFVWLIVPLVKAKGSVGYTPAKDVFANGDLNLSGWNAFVAFMIGTAGVGAGYGIPDAVTHVAEETPRPEVDLPKIMILSPLISLITATAMCLSFLFCNVPQIAMAMSPTGVPFIDYLEATVGNRAGVTVMSVILIYAQFVACLESQLASSRTLFTFAREGGAFLPSIFGRVNLILQVPIWTILFNFLFCAALTLLILGSQTALNVFLNCSGTLALCTYVPLIIAALAGKRRFYKGPFSLGRWGYFVNITATVYLTLVVIFWFFPYTKAWQSDINMFNFNIAIVPGVMLLGVLAWFASGRNSYLLHRTLY